MVLSFTTSGSSPAQSFMYSNSAGLMTKFYCFRSKTSPKLEHQVPIFISRETGWPSYTTRYCVPFSSLPTTRRATVEVMKPTYTGGTSDSQPSPFLITFRHEPRRKHSFSVACCQGNVFKGPFSSIDRAFLLIKNLLPSNGSRSVVCIAVVA
jgi:hypothetical protein